MGLRRALAPSPLIPLALGLALCAGVARADAPSPAEARARALFDEAAKLLAEARVEEACRKLAESESLAPNVTTLQRLATCEEAEGKLARALAAYRQLTVLAGRQLRGARERAVLARVQRLEASVPRLLVRLSPEAAATPDLEVRACGVALREGEIGLAVPEDPGTCEVSARAPGKATWTKSVELGARGERVEVIVPPLEPEATAPAPSTAEATPPSEVTPPEPPPPPPPTGPATERRVTGIALVGMGVALAGAGAFFGLEATESAHDSNAICPTQTCADPEGLHLNARALTEAKLANLTVGAGAVAFVTGVVVLVTGHARPSPARAASRTWLGPTPGGVAFGGAF